MSREPTITREICSLPVRDKDAHKGSVGRIFIVAGCAGEVMMAGAPALCANAAFHGGAGLVQMCVPEGIRTCVATLAPSATVRTLPADGEGILQAAVEFKADVMAIGPGLGDSVAPETIVELLNGFDGPIVLDADGLNLLADNGAAGFSDPARVVMTPHAGELQRLLAARGKEIKISTSVSARKAAATELVELFGSTVVLKGHGTVVTDGNRSYVNETGNAGMATGGAGDVLTGLIAALIGQEMTPFEGAILGVYLHGLAGDFAAEELGRLSMTAMDLVDYLPEALCEHDLSGNT